MKEELQQQLFNKYPQIFIKHIPARHPFDQWGIECNDGWYDLIDKTCQKIQDILDEDNSNFFQTAQLKEKFSLLRWYYDADEKNNKKYQKIIDATEKESANICENCGTNENVSTNDIRSGWMLTLCKKCRTQSKN